MTLHQTVEATALVVAYCSFSNWYKEMHYSRRDKTGRMFGQNCTIGMYKMLNNKLIGIVEYKPLKPPCLIIFY